MMARRHDERSLAHHDVSPLVEIELAVQARAKHLGLDLDQPGGLAELAELVRSEVSQWRLDFERGLRPFELNDPEGVGERAIRNIAGYGPLEPLLRDDDVFEIMVNSPSAIFVKRHSGASGYHDEVFHDDEHVTRTLTKILDDAVGPIGSWIRRKDSRTPTWRAERGCTSCTAISDATATCWSTFASSRASASSHCPNSSRGACSSRRLPTSFEHACDRGSP